MKNFLRTERTLDFVRYLRFKVRELGAHCEKKAEEEMAEEIGITGNALRNHLDENLEDYALNSSTLNKYRDCKRLGAPEWIDQLLHIDDVAKAGAKDQSAKLHCERANQFAASLELFSGSALFETLMDLYPNRCFKGERDLGLFRFNGHLTPLVVWPAQERITSKTSPPLASLSCNPGLPGVDDFPKEFDQMLRAHFLEEVPRARRPDGSIWTDPTFTMNEIVSTEDGVRLHCGLGRYLLAVNTCDVLESELLRIQASKFGDKLMLKDLEARSRLHALLEKRNPIFNGHHRSAAVAVSTLTVFANPTPDRFQVFLQHRSLEVRNHACLAHVIPSGMLGPVFRPAVPDEEFSIYHVVLREWYEELFNSKIAAHPVGIPSPQWLYGRAPVRGLIEMLNAQDPSVSAELWYTGLAVNLMNLRPEICTVLIIRDPTWFTKALNGFYGGEDLQICDFEFNPAGLSPRLLQHCVLRGFSGRVPLTKDLELDLSEPLHPKILVPPAAAAIDLGLKVARMRLGIEDPAKSRVALLSKRSDW